MPDWEQVLADSERRHVERAGAEPVRERRDLQLAAVASASWGAGLSLLMLGRRDEAAARFRQAADEYRVSADAAPPGSWGRPLAALRCRLLAGDEVGAGADAVWVLELGATQDGGSVACYAAALAGLALRRDEQAAPLAAALAGRDDFPSDVADALAALARGDAPAYEQAVRRVLRSFETRDAYLEDVAVADTVLVLQALASARGLAPTLESPLLPG